MPLSEFMALRLSFCPVHRLLRGVGGEGELSVGSLCWKGEPRDSSLALLALKALK